MNKEALKVVYQVLLPNIFIRSYPLKINLEISFKKALDALEWIYLKF